MLELLKGLTSMTCCLSKSKYGFGCFLLFCSLMKPSEARIKTVKSGQLEGILTQKSANWIDVRADDGYVNRYMPYWKGESPSRGGGFDPRMLEVISNLVVGNRVYLSWQWDGHLRINQVDIIVPPEESGTFEGYLLDVGDKWIDVQNFNEGKPWRFYLPWIGGYPQGGGGYDREMLKFFHDHNPKIPVYFDWRFDLRPRITRIVKYEEAKFVPFFVGKEEEYIRRMTGEERKKEQAPTGNPFEQAPTGNPFEQAPTGNPFEQAPTDNPFENLPLPE